MGMHSLENRPLRQMPRIWTKAIIRLIVSLPHHRMRNALHTTYMTSCESLLFSCMVANAMLALVGCLLVSLLFDHIRPPKIGKYFLVKNNVTSI